MSLKSLSAKQVKQAAAEHAASKAAKVEKAALSAGEAIDQILTILGRLDDVPPEAVAEAVVNLVSPEGRTVGFQYSYRA